ncbi:MAG: hypothetical protein WEC34_10260 [Acidimicrobiia bacterium]
MTEPLRDEDPTKVAPPPDTGARDADDHADPDAGPGLPPPTAVESLVGALLEAGPEVAEHVVRAAQELLLAVQAIVDAADRAVKEQQSVRADQRDDASAGDPAPEPAGAADADAAVRHLDLAE